MRVAKAFDYSLDGINPLHLEPGDDPAGVPAEFIAGLKAEGYLEEGEPENKVIEAAPETGEAVLLTDEEIHADLEALGVEFDPRDDLATKTALRDEARAKRAEAEMQPAEDPVVEAAPVDAAPETAGEAGEAAQAGEQADAAPEVAEAAEGPSEAAEQPESAAAPVEGAAEGAGEAGAEPASDAYPHLSDAQEKALDGDGDGKPGGRKKKA